MTAVRGTADLGAAFRARTEYDATCAVLDETCAAARGARREAARAAARRAKEDMVVGKNTLDRDSDCYTLSPKFRRLGKDYLILTPPYMGACRIVNPQSSTTSRTNLIVRALRLSRTSTESLQEFRNKRSTRSFATMRCNA